jgi:hypothetical protein
MLIGRELVKRLRLLDGRSEFIKTRFEVDFAGRLVEHVTLETHDRPACGWSGGSESAAAEPQGHVRRTRRRI